ncbi:hypothetical protein [Halalkalibaculum sp. DA384]|uniref:hypothetical protein n=1 Tax=Halalkalibaculum sp. DA384 TaxID=3373606 RepID=UPI0037549290
MNTQLEQLLQQAQYYTPSKTITIESGKTNTLIFTGLNGNAYGVNRMLPGGSGLSQITATVAFNNGRDKRFEDVQLETLRNLFLARSLRGAIVIERGTEVIVTLTNNDSSDHQVNFSLVGYDSAHLHKKQASYRANGVKFPEPEFVYITETINAGVGQQRFSVNLPAYKLRLYRMAASTTGTDSEIRLSIRQGRTRIKPEVFLQQLNDEFRDKDIILPRTLQAHTPFDLFVTNSGASAHQVSFLAECYRI